jgi:sulfite reductase (NADPH) hemoprotein beta-component
VGGVIGPSFSAGQVPSVIASILDVYVGSRAEGERFVDTLARIGVAPFKAAAYAGNAESGAAEALADA